MRTTLPGLLQARSYLAQHKKALDDILKSDVFIRQFFDFIAWALFRLAKRVRKARAKERSRQRNRSGTM